MIAVPLEMYSKFGQLNKMDFSQRNVGIGWKMTNGQLLYLALLIHIEVELYYVLDSKTEINAGGC